MKGVSARAQTPQWCSAGTYLHKHMPEWCNRFDNSQWHVTACTYMCLSASVTNHFHHWLEFLRASQSFLGLQMPAAGRIWNNCWMVCFAVGSIAPTFLFASAMFNFVLLLHNLVSHSALCSIQLFLEVDNSLSSLLINQQSKLNSPNSHQRLQLSRQSTAPGFHVVQNAPASPFSNLLFPALFQIGF